LIYEDEDDSLEKIIGHLVKKIDPENFGKMMKEWKEKYE
jgi:hypothetical protein